MTPIKPRYRLGTQYHLDLAKDDATKIPERTLFRVSRDAFGFRPGTIVMRGHRMANSDNYRCVAFSAVDEPGGDYYYFCVLHLQPLI